MTETNEAEARFLAKQASRTQARTTQKTDDNDGATGQSQQLTTEFWVTFNVNNAEIEKLFEEASKMNVAVTASQRLVAEKRLATIITRVQDELIRATALASTFLVDHDVGRGTRTGEEALAKVEQVSE